MSCCRESGEGVTAAGPEPGPGLQPPAPARLRESLGGERESVATGARPVSHEPRQGNTKICREQTKIVKSELITFDTGRDPANLCPSINLLCIENIVVNAD